MCAPSNLKSMGMMNGLRRFVWLSLAISFLAIGSAAQNRGTVWGIVSDASTNQPIPQVNITVQGLKSGLSSDAQGRYALRVTPGVISLKISHISYRAQLITVTIRGGDSVRADIRLEQTAISFAEVTVAADSLPVARVRSLGAIAISTVEMKNVSGAFGDVGKSIQTMAGVTSNNEMSGQFNVRGGTMSENLLVLNGIELIEPYHLKESPNSSVGIFNVSLLSRVLFIPGGFSARYGDRLSAVVDLEQREGNADRFGARLDASLSDVMTVVEGPIAKGGSALLSFRSSYGDFVSKYLTDKNQRWPTFYDVSGSVALDPWEGQHLALQMLHASDQTHGLSDGEYSTTLIGLQSTSTLSSTWTLHSSLSMSRQYEDLTRTTGIVLDNAVNGSRDSTKIALIEASFSADIKILPTYSIAAGLWVQRCDYSGSRSEALRIDSLDIFQESSLNRHFLKTGLYAENIVQISPVLLLNGGIRFDVSSLTGEARLSPRFLASYQVDDRTYLKAAWGIYYQTPTYYQLLAAGRAGEPPQQMQQAVHYLIGVERSLKKGIRVHAEVYFKQLNDLISFERLRSGDFVYSALNDSRGEIKGVDFEATYRDEHISGWWSVSWMNAREVKNAAGEKWHLRPTNQRITINFVFEPKITEHLVLSLRSMYGSGFAFVDDLPGTKSYQINHYPDYKRIDLRLNYSFEAWQLRSTAFVEVTNLLSMRNVQSFKGTQYDWATPDYVLLLPMIINVGMRWEY